MATPNGESIPESAADQTTHARTVAIDWSGAKQGVRRKLWLAEVRSGRCVRLEAGRDRAEIADHLVAEAERSPNLIVGLDFAFSLPEWVIRERGVDSAAALWRLVTSEGERWLAECAPPFWGRPGKRRPEVPEHFRQTERMLPAVAGTRPKSTLQIGGAGAVGTGSIRGMPLLARLQEAGYAIWPFDPVRLPVVVEIYPRILTGAVVKSDRAEREKYLSRLSESQHPELLDFAASSEDAFDAFISALIMDENRRHMLALPAIADVTAALEGVIWTPSSTGEAVSP